MGSLGLGERVKKKIRIRQGYRVFWINQTFNFPLAERLQRPSLLSIREDVNAINMVRLVAGTWLVSLDPLALCAGSSDGLLVVALGGTESEGFLVSLCSVDSE